MSWLKAVEDTVTGLGYEVVDCERNPKGLLRVYIDRLPDRTYDQPSEFVTVEDCEKCTRQLQYALEVANADYARLEVSSPGLDRPLKTPEHYVRFTGLEVEITLKMPFQGRKKYKGVLESVPAAEGVANAHRRVSGGCDVQRNHGQPHYCGGRNAGLGKSASDFALSVQ